MDKIYKFSPSEFAYGYQGCKRCYYDEKARNILGIIAHNEQVFKREVINNKKSD